MIDTIKVPYKIETKIETWEGDFTAEEIDSGLAGQGRVETSSHWYENIDGVPTCIEDEDRIKELENRT